MAPPKGPDSGLYSVYRKESVSPGPARLDPVSLRTLAVRLRAPGLPTLLPHRRRGLR